MRKHLLLILMLMVLGLPFASQAQQMSVTVADGTATNNYVPIYGMYCDDFIHTQIIYPASELGVLPATGTISQLTFYASSAPAAAWTSQFEFKIGECTASTFASAAWDTETSMTSVYSGTVDATSGTMTVVLTTPYTYNGGNLLIDIASITDGNYKGVTWIGTTLTGASISGYNSSSAASASAGSKNFLPKVTFLTSIPEGYCVPVSNLAAANITSSSASISWTAGGSETSWQYVYGAQGFTPDWTSATTVTTTSISLTGLSAMTGYDLYVRSICSATSNSAGIKVSFRTACVSVDLTTLGVIGFETTEGFVTGSNPSFTNCWTFGNMQSTNTSYSPYIYANTSYSTYSYEGSSCLYLNASSSSYTNADSAYAVMPEFLTTNLSQHMLRFYAKQSSTSSTYAKNLIVGVMTDPLDMSTFVQAGTVEVSGTTYAQYEVSLATYSGTGKYIALLATVDPESTASYKYARYYVDNLEVLVIPSCVRPTDVALSSISNTSAQISWTAGGSETTWSIRYKSATDADWTTINNVTTNPYTLTGLTSATSYEVGVKSICSATDESEYSNTTSFTTLCDPITQFPWTENFEGFSANQIPTCWDNSMSTTSSLTYNPHYVWGVYSYSENNMLRMYNYYVQSGLAVINFPVIAIPATSVYELTLDYAHNSTSGDFNINISTDGVNFTTLGTLTKGSGSSHTDPGTFTTVTYNLSAYAGQNVIIQLWNQANYGSGSIFVDNIIVAEAPSCIKPSDVAVSNISNTSAQISWTAGGTETTWNIQYKVATDTVWTTVNNVTTNPYTLTGLTSATSYEVAVQSICSANDISEWTTPVLFETAICPIENQCQLMVVMNDSWGDGWNGNAKLYLVETTSNMVASFATLTNGYVDTAYLTVCDGLTYNICWQAGYFDSEISFVIYGIDNVALYTSSSLSEGVLATFTASCVIPSCYPVTNVAISNVAKNTADVAWNLIDTTENNFVVAYGIGTDPTTMSTVTATTNNVTLTGLTSATAYNVYVKAVCSATDESTWSSVASFFTLCDAFDFAVNDTISQTFANGLECWTAVSANTDNNLYYGVTQEYGFDDSASFRFSSYNQADNYNQYLISQELSSTTPINISFYVNNQGYGYSGESFRIVYSTTTIDTASFTNVVLDTTIATSNTWLPITAQVPAEAKYIAINYYSNYEYYLLVDNIVITAEQPAGPDPVSNLTATFDNFASVNLTWTAPAGAESIMTYSNGNCTSAIGYGASVNMDAYIAQRFPAEDLVAYQGMEVTKVKFVPYSQSATYTVTVWIGDQVGQDSAGYPTYTPTAIAASKVATGFVAQEWTTVTLDTAVAVPATGAMWIGVRCVGAGYIAPTDNGPAVIGKGDLIQDGQTFYDLNDWGLNYNFCVMGVASAASADKNAVNELHEVVLNGTTGTIEETATPAEISRGNAFECTYIVKEGTTVLGTTILPSYTAAVTTTGVHTYCVEVDYGTTQSAPTCVDITINALACGTPTDVRWVDYQESMGEGVVAIFATEPVGSVLMEVIWVDYDNMVVADWDPTQYGGAAFQLYAGTTYCFGIRSACLFGGDTVRSAISDTVCIYLPLVCQPAEALNGQCTAANTVNLMWGASSNAIAYNIYRDDEPIATNLELDDLIYTDTNVPAGVHSYYVTGVCEDASESDPTDPVQIVVTAVNENAAENAVIYPNPAKDQFRVVAEGMNRVVVSTILGQVVYETVADGNEVVVATDNLESGIYMVVVETNNGAATKRINVVR